MSIKAVSVSVVLFLSAINTSQANLLQSGFNAEYDVNYNGMELGVSKRHLSMTENQIAIFEAATFPEGFAALLIKETISETSKVKITHKSIQPIQYIESKDKKGKTEKYQLSFNWHKNTLNNGYKKTTEPLKPNTHDLLSFQLKMMQDLQKHKKNMLYRIATKRHTRNYKLKIINTEKIETTMGEFEVIKLTSKSDEGKSQFTFWCAPALEFLPIKIQKINDKGNQFSFTLRSFLVEK